MTDVSIIIPARFASSRYPGKPLVLLEGADGTRRSLLERSVMAAQRAADSLGPTTTVHVATDDDRIAAEAARIGVAVIMTDPTCQNGTERVAQAVGRAGIDSEIIINLQGDAPLTPPHFVVALVDAMRAKPTIQMATPVLRCEAEALENFRADRRAGRVGATTVVRDLQGQALYFSKEIIPFTNDRTEVDGIVPVFHHVGLYGYRPSALSAYSTWPCGPLEQLEGLEQLRFLENGHPVAAIEVSAPGAAFWELNNPSDVPLIEAYLKRLNLS